MVIRFHPKKTLNFTKTQGLKINSVAKYGKGIGYNFKHIKNRIDNGHPVILSFYNDGRNYQSNHTVTIIGY